MGWGNRFSSNDGAGVLMHPDGPQVSIVLLSPSSQLIAS